MPDLLSLLPTIIGELAGAFVWVGLAVGVLVVITIGAALCCTASDADDESRREQNDWRGI